MAKKILLITLFILFAGALIAGGVYRTSAKSGFDISLGGEEIVTITQNAEEGRPRNEGAGLNQEHVEDGQRQGQGLGNGGVGQGRNQKAGSESNEPLASGQGNQVQGNQGFQGGQGRSQQVERSGEAYQEHEPVTIEGTVIQAPAAGVDMIVQTAGGQEILVGTGPGYLQEMGYELLKGDMVQVNGFWEDEEFKAETITSDGQMIALRDEFGRPMWSGAGRRANSQSGQGNQSNGRQARDGSAKIDS